MLSGVCVDGCICILYHPQCVTFVSLGFSQCWMSSIYVSLCPVHCPDKQLSKIPLLRILDDYLFSLSFSY